VIISKRNVQGKTMNQERWESVTGTQASTWEERYESHQTYHHCPVIMISSMIIIGL